MSSSKYVFGFVGASGSGKSTLLRYLADNYEVTSVEISPRQFFDKEKGSYDVQNTDLIQTKILMHNMDMTHRMIEMSIAENMNIAVSRTPIDVLAYCQSLKKANEFKDIQMDLIRYLKNFPNYKFIYCPIEFPLKNNDKIRGMNETIRKETDENIYRILTENKIDFQTVSGSFKEREMELDSYLGKLWVSKKKKNGLFSKWF